MPEWLRAAYFCTSVIAGFVACFLAFSFWSRYSDRFMKALVMMFVLLGVGHAIAGYGSVVGNYTPALTLAARWAQIIGLGWMLYVVRTNDLHPIGVKKQPGFADDG